MSELVTVWSGSLERQARDQAIRRGDWQPEPLPAALLTPDPWEVRCPIPAPRPRKQGYQPRRKNGIETIEERVRAYLQRLDEPVSAVTVAGALKHNPNSVRDVLHLLVEKRVVEAVMTGNRFGHMVRVKYRWRGEV